MILAPSARTHLLNAAFSLIRAKGYSATSVDDLCRAAGVTKGAFFHHFKSKEELAVAAAQHWSDVTGALFAAAPYHALPDPLDRVLGYLDFRMADINWRKEYPNLAKLSEKLNKRASFADTVPPKS